MFSKRSIRSQFLVQLLVASVALIFIFSTALYFFISKSIYDDKEAELLKFAQNICAYESLYKELQSDTDSLLDLNVELIILEDSADHIEWYIFNKNRKSYLTLIYPYNLKKMSYLKVSKDVSSTEKLLKKIMRTIILLNIITLGILVLYAYAVSGLLSRPIALLSRRLSNMNEHLIHPIKVKELPEEFVPLGETLNHLISRIHNFVKYQKELFIGAAHELKTPLAVIKLKNQVTLIKERQAHEYIEALQVTNNSVDDMNKIVADILNIGRQESAHLEKPIEIDIIKVLEQKGNDFKLLAESDSKVLETNLLPNSFMATMQVKLLNQIVQNFLQNALKFTPADKKVLLQSNLCKEGLLIEVIDEGCGVDESMDLFAPFKRQGNKSGVGLGLFLAASAADAIGAKIAIKNRVDGADGTVASLKINSKLCCILPS
ncbi:MAG: sensor histidine kinase [Helicobacteraceae bacterium]|nr:sensor histidine kinase [Helicobacteraceae bacterium]